MRQRLMSISGKQGSRKEILDFRIPRSKSRAGKCGMPKEGFTKFTVYLERSEKGKEFTGTTIYTCSNPHL